MRNIRIPFFAIIVVALLNSCNEVQKTTSAEDQDTCTTVALTVIPDSTIWGYIGDGTAMSVVEFITESDTLYLNKESEYTGKYATILGDIIYNDRFAITTCDGGETLLHAINVSQLMGKWKMEGEKITIKSDGTIQNKPHSYDGWKIENGKLLLHISYQNEYSQESSRIDTMTILSLNTDSLVIKDHLEKIITYKR